MIVIFSTVVYAPPKDKTGFHVVIESYGYELIDYEVSDKFKFNGEQYTAIDIIIDDNGIQYTLVWIMKKERYNELKEKV